MFGKNPKGIKEMYSQFFGFKENPFSLSASPTHLYLSKSHEEAMAHLIYAESEGEGFVSLIGERGIGKTTICRAFIERRNKSTEIAYILDPKLSPKELLKKINSAFKIKAHADDVKGLIDSLNEFLMQKRLEGKKVVLFLDEAQDLNAGALEQVRLLSNLETTRGKLLQIVLVGDPKLVEILGSRALRQIGQRVSVSYHIEALTLDETSAYIDHRISISSLGDPVQFDSSAVKRIHKYSRGIPRLINIACAKSLSTAHSLNCNYITGDIAKAAILELTGSPGWRGSGFLNRRVVALAAVVGCLIAIAVMLAYFPRQTSEKSLAAKAEVTAINIEEPQPAKVIHTSKPAVDSEVKKTDGIPKKSDAEKPPVEAAAISAPTPKPAKSIQLSTEMTHSVQVGAFLNQEYGLELRETLMIKGYPARIVTLTDSEEKTWYTVRIGDYPSRNIAQQHAEAFSAQEKMESAVRPYGKF